MEKKMDNHMNTGVTLHQDCTIFIGGCAGT